MAQTKASTRRKTSSSGAGNRSRSSAQKRTNGRAKQGNRQSSRSRPSASRNGRQTASKKTASKGTTSKGLESVKDSVSSGAQNAAQEVAGAAKSAKTVLLAGGAAAAGAAAAVVVAKSGNNSKFGLNGRKRGGIHLDGLMPRRSGLKVDAKKVAGTVTDAAKRADRFGQRVSRVASSVQKVSETADEAARKA